MDERLISLNAAIDTLKNRWKKTRHYEGIGDDIAEECELYLKQVPSAQPSVSKEEMVGDTISRQAAIETVRKAQSIGQAHRMLVQLPSAQPEIIKCKDCKRWRDSDGVYRRGTDAESKCPLNTKEVYAGTFYCGYAERRTDERTD